MTKAIDQPSSTESVSDRHGRLRRQLIVKGLMDGISLNDLAAIFDCGLESIRMIVGYYGCCSQLSGTGRLYGAVCIEEGARLKLGTNTKLSDYATIPDLLRKIHAVHEVLEARVQAQTIHPEVGPQEVRKVG